MLKNRLKKIFDNTDVETILLMNGGGRRDPNFLYVTQFTYGFFEHAVLIVKPDTYTLVTTIMEEKDAREQLDSNSKLIVIDSTKTSPKETWEIIKKEAASDVVGINDDFLRVKSYNEILEYFKETVPVSNAFEKARVIKEDYEIEKIQKSADIVSLVADRIHSFDFENVDKLITTLKSNLKRRSRKRGDVNMAISKLYEIVPYFATENELGAVIEYSMKKRGSSEPSFPTISSSGRNSAYVHFISSEKKIDVGDSMLCDFGATVDNYVSDLSRTFFYRKVSKEKRRLYEEVLNIQEECVDAIYPGVLAKDVANIFYSRVEKLGHKPLHGLGHMIGLEVHDCIHNYLINRSQGDFELEEGMVFTIEPGIYIKDFGGVRIEDDILVTKNGCKVLTTAKKRIEEVVI